MNRADRSLAYWGAGVFQRDTVAEEHLAAMVAHPRFADACKLIEQGSIELTASPSNAPILRDVSGAFYGIFTLYLDARGGLTLTSIQEFCEEAGLASPNRSAALLFQLRAKGFVTRDQAQKDRRVRRYIPAPIMVETMRKLFLNNLEGLAMLAPEAQTFIDRMDEPALFRDFLLGVGDGLVRLLKNQQRTAVTLFTERNFGVQMLYHMVSTAAEGDVFSPKGPVRMSVTDLAARFPASRSHILKLLRDAERHGFLTRNADAQTGVLHDALRDALVLFHAGLLMGTAGNTSRALAENP